MALLLLLIPLGQATTVAVIGRHNSTAPLSDEATAEAVRQVFLGDGVFDPIPTEEVLRRARDTREPQVEQARARLAAARVRFEAGDAEGAIPLLEEAIRLHDAALSYVWARQDRADAFYLLGLCQVRAGRTVEARASFDEVSNSVTEYTRKQATSSARNAAESEFSWADRITGGCRPELSPTEGAMLATVLRVDVVIIACNNSSRNSSSINMTLTATDAHGHAWGKARTNEKEGYDLLDASRALTWTIVTEAAHERTPFVEDLFAAAREHPPHTFEAGPHTPLWR